MPLNPKQMRAFREKLMRERQRLADKDEAKHGDAPLRAFALGDPQKSAAGAVMVADDDWLHELRPGFPPALKGSKADEVAPSPDDEA